MLQNFACDSDGLPIVVGIQFEAFLIHSFINDVTMNFSDNFLMTNFFSGYWLKYYIERYVYSVKFEYSYLSHSIKKILNIFFFKKFKTDDQCRELN